MLTGSLLFLFCTKAAGLCSNDGRNAGEDKVDGDLCDVRCKSGDVCIHIWLIESRSHIESVGVIVESIKTNLKSAKNFVHPQEI